MFSSGNPTQFLRAAEPEGSATQGSAALRSCARYTGEASFSPATSFIYSGASPYQLN
jgi:hypothetical protein